VPLVYINTYRINYLDNALGYGFELKPKTRALLALHHFFNVKSEQIRYTPPLVPTTTSQYIEVRPKPSNVSWNKEIFDLTKQGFKFYNHFAASLELDYMLSKNGKIGISYIIGLNDFNPLDKEFRAIFYKTPGVNQNFSVFISHNLYAFK
jgi:hypothetical protein